MSLIDKLKDEHRQKLLDKIEKELFKDLNNFFNDLGKLVIRSLKEYYNPNYLLMRLERILSPISNTETHKYYYELISSMDRDAYNLGVDEANHLYSIIKDKDIVNKSENDDFDNDDWFAPSDETINELMNDVFIASMNTLLRVNEEMRKIIIEGYKTGNGIDYIAKQITSKFYDYSHWEAVRIARTETHNAHNRGAYNTYQGLGVEYTIWLSAHDNRVRSFKKGDKADHVIMDEEIKPLNELYSNGLKYPGDTRGPIAEWINCRCRNAPYVLPWGYIPPPDKQQFKKDELIKVE